MKPRIYLRLLQPARTARFALGYTTSAFLIGHAIFKFDWHESLFVTGTVTLPLLFGAALTGLLHAVLHRPFAVLLPDLPRKLRRAAAVSYLALATLVTVAIALIEPTAPAPAVFGLALGLLTLSCANRRQGFPRIMILGVLSGSLALIFALLVFHLRFAHGLLPALQAAPWAFFIGGSATAAALFSFGFARRTLRERATTPYFATAYTRASGIDIPAFRRQIQEETRFNFDRGIRKSRPGRDWPLSFVGPHRRDWLRVIDHQRAISPARFHIGMFSVLVIVIIIEVGMFGTLGLLHQPRSFHVADFLAVLASMTAPASAGISELSNLLIIAVFLPVSMPMLLGTTFSRPLLSYPLARVRLAKVVFAHTCRDLLVGLLVPSLAFWASSLAGQVANGNLHPGLGLPAMAVIVLVFVPFLPLLALQNYPGRTPARKLASRLGLFFSFAVFLGLVTVVRLKWSHFILSPGGVFVSLLTTIAGLNLLRSRIRRHYGTCDLIDEAARTPPFGAPSATSR